MDVHKISSYNMTSTKGPVNENPKEPNNGTEYCNGISDCQHNRVPKIFEGKRILITGATGFVGKVLIEKLLRVCPHLDKIYVIVREKRDKNPQQRMKEIFDSPLYDLLKITHGEEILNKVIVVPGSISESKLGLSDADRKELIEKVNFVYHSAATVKFDEKLKSSILINARGTKLMLELSSQMKNLQFFGHISTAYCHLEEDILKEQFYPSPDDPHRLITLAEILSDQEFEHLSKKMMKGKGNTYSFTKALAEALVEEKVKTMPIIVFRPSMVVPIWHSPLIGWTDNMNGQFGACVAAGKGVLRSIHVDPSNFCDNIPVDYVANALIVITAFHHMNRGLIGNVLHLTSGTERVVTFQEMVDLGLHAVREEYPFKIAAWYPSLTLNPNKFVHWITVLFYQLIPAFFGDLLLRLFGFEPILMRVQRKIYVQSQVIECYLSKKIVMENEEALNLRGQLNEEESKIFHLSNDVNLKELVDKSVYAIRTYVLKESPDSIPAARKLNKRLYYVSCIFQILFYVLLVWLLVKYYNIWIKCLYFAGNLFTNSVSASSEKITTVHAVL